MSAVDVPKTTVRAVAPARKRKAFKLGWLDRLLAFVLWLMAVIFTAGFVHIVSIFALPHLAEKDAYSRLSALAEPNRLTLLPPALPGQEYAPFEDPALVQAACLYDLDKGPLAFSADIPNDGLLTFSFHTRTGRVFYSMTDRAASHGKIDVTVFTPKQLDAVDDSDDDDEPAELRLTSPEAQGFVLINALAALPSERAKIEAMLKSMTCETYSD